jgi:hypothetical protein
VYFDLVFGFGFSKIYRFVSFIENNVSVRFGKRIALIIIKVVKNNLFAVKQIQGDATYLATTRRKLDITLSVNLVFLKILKNVPSTCHRNCWLLKMLKKKCFIFPRETEF